MNLHPSAPIVVTLTRMESMRMAIAWDSGLWPYEGYPDDAVAYAFRSQGSLLDRNGDFRPVAWVTSLAVHDLSPVSYSETDWEGGAPE